MIFVQITKSLSSCSAISLKINAIVASSTGRKASFACDCKVHQHYLMIYQAKSSLHYLKLRDMLCLSKFLHSSGKVKLSQLGNKSATNCSIKESICC